MGKDGDGSLQPMLEIKVCFVHQQGVLQKAVNSTLSSWSIFALVSLQPGVTEKIGRHQGRHSFLLSEVV